MTFSQILSHNPWRSPCQSIWPASSFSLKRNLKKEPFPHRQEALKAKNLLETIEQKLKQSALTQEMSLLDFNALAPDEKEALFARCFLDIQSYEDRPCQSVFCNPSKNLLVCVNLDNHLCLHAIDYHNDWFGSWNRLVDIDNCFARQLDYAFSSRFGFLTKKLQDLGLGLQAKAYLHLPLLSSDKAYMQSLQDHQEWEEISLQKHPHFDLYAVTNRYNLGYTEEALIKTVQEKAQLLTEKERLLRKTIEKEQGELIKKNISLSLGLLLHGRFLSAQEIQKALSFLKLGVDLKWVEGIEETTLNHLCFQKPLNSSTLAYQDAVKSASLLF
jgi:protein arginine kinase